MADITAEKWPPQPILRTGCWQMLATLVNCWHIRPSGTEGYRTAEVTLGGVDTGALSSSDMQVKSCPGLYFIGEVVDVTGHLGGHNFQWAWASAYAASASKL